MLLKLAIDKMGFYKMIINDKQIVQLMFFCQTFQKLLITEKIVSDPDGKTLYIQIEETLCEIMNQQSEELKGTD